MEPLLEQFDVGDGEHMTYSGSLLMLHYVPLAGQVGQLSEVLAAVELDPRLTAADN